MRTLMKNLGLLLFLITAVPTPVHADEADIPASLAPPTPIATPPLGAASGTSTLPHSLAPPTDPDAKTRNFYQVLEDVLADFEYDLKNGQVVGLKDLAIRNIAVSEGVPNSFKSHLELLVSERIMKTTKTRIVHCLACRSKKATLNRDNVVISNPDANQEDLSRIAKMNGVSNFMDIAYSYQPSGMILSLNIYDTDTGTMLWSRSYNSETSRAAAFRRGVDYSQLDEARTKSEYVPTLQYRPILYWIMTPKPGSGETTALDFGFRMVERYDNRKKEVGFEVNYFYDYNSLIGLNNGQSNLYGGFNLTMLFVHAWNLIGDEENYNKPRGSIMAGIGGSYASGYLGGLVRLSYEWRFAKHWALSTFLGYRPPATVVLPDSSTAHLTGVEGGIGVGYLFP